MSAAAEAPHPTRTASEWVRKYPPLISILVALLLAVAVLPSALNLPQTNPTQTLEYAPVPPSDDEPPPPSGNLSSLGLGSSSGIAAEGFGGSQGTIPPLGKGVSPSTKRCVGNPPRQTEDPIAPPCVAYFAGDNFGGTYQGVTREEIRLLIFIDSGIQEFAGSRGSEVRPTETYYDLFDPPSSKGEHVQIESYRAWQRYFNDRFQTYGRVVHFFIFFSSADKSPEGRRADAADNFDKIRPFAVLTDNILGNEVDYVDYMAKKGVLNFGSFTGKRTEFFRTYPKLIWGYDPSLEFQSNHFVEYVCKKVVGLPAALSGNPGENGKPRKLGILHTSDDNWPELIFLAEDVKKKVQECGGEIEAEATFPQCCFARSGAENPSYAADQMADFQSAGITTILWTAGINGNMAKAAAGQGYYPEWILLGDGTFDTNHPTRWSDSSPSFDGHAIAVSNAPFEPGLEQQLCWQALREAGATRPRADMHWMCEPYRNLFQLFTGIQVAGPRLGPTSIDKGFHAIPPVRSTDVRVPACFYNSGDYTCVKDAQQQVWDADGAAPGDDRPGCWRAIEGGRRFLHGEWPKGNINAQIKGDEPCNGRSVAVVYRLT